MYTVKPPNSGYTACDYYRSPLFRGCLFHGGQRDVEEKMCALKLLQSKHYFANIVSNTKNGLLARVQMLVNKSIATYAL